eukprot:3022082-Pyramimonas_sp.AAC.1
MRKAYASPAPASCTTCGRGPYAESMMCPLAVTVGPGKTDLGHTLIRLDTLFCRAPRSAAP